MFEIFNAVTAYKISRKKNEKLQKENIQLVFKLIKESVKKGKISETFTLRCRDTLDAVKTVLVKKGYRVEWEERIKHGIVECFEIKVSWLVDGKNNDTM